MSDDETYKSENNSFKDELDGALLAEEQRKREDEQQRIEAEQRRIEEEQRRKESEQQRIAYLENEYANSIINSIKTKIKEQIKNSRHKNTRGGKKVEGTLTLSNDEIKKNAGWSIKYVEIRFTSRAYYEINIGVIKLINAVKELAEREGIVIKSCYFSFAIEEYYDTYRGKLKLHNNLKKVNDNLKIRRLVTYNNDDCERTRVRDFDSLNFGYSIKF